MSQADQPVQGTLIRDYRLEERLSEDVLGEVWLARHQVTGSAVTIRFLRPEGLNNEAGPHLRGLTELRHPTMVSPLEVFVNVSMPHIVYEPVAGTRLDTFLTSGPIPWPNAAQIVQELLSVLQYLHTRGVLYGHLLPAGVQISGEGDVSLADVGVQMAAEASWLSLRLGRTVALTASDDVRGAGLLLWTLVSGQAPPADGTAPDCGATIPPTIAQFITGCCAAGSAEGFADAGAAYTALLAAMETALAAEPTAADEAPGEGPGEGPDAPAAEAVTDAPADDGDAPAAATMPTPRRASPHGGVEERVAELERALAEAASPAARQELTRLLELQGRAQLHTVSGIKGRAFLTRQDRASTLTLIAYAVGCLIGFGLLWWIANSFLQETPLSDQTRLVLKILALGAYLVLGVWIGVALTMSHARVACYVVISDLEVLCHDEQRSTLIEHIRAADVRAVSVLSPPGAPPEECRLQIEGRSGKTCTLDFAARVRG